MKSSASSWLRPSSFPGITDVYIGQEATAVAACAALRPDDFVFTTWRNHGHLLARGTAPGRMMAEILGKAGGYAGGRSGTLHLSVRELGVPATSALVGGSLPLATGAALACKRRGSGITVSFFGDAALEEGALLRSDDHRRSVAGSDPVRVREQQHSARAAQARTVHLLHVAGGATGGRAQVPLRIPIEVVDGADASALADCFDRLVGEMRRDGGPKFLEVRCTRWPGSFPLWPELPCGEWQVAWAFDQKPDRPDLAVWLEQSDPLVLHIRALAAADTLDRRRIEEIDARIRAEIADAVRFALDSPLPAAAEAYRYVWATGEPIS